MRSSTSGEGASTSSILFSSSAILWSKISACSNNILVTAPVSGGSSAIFEEFPSLNTARTAHFGDGKVVLGQSGVNALLKLGSLSDQNHSCPGKLSLVPA